MTRRHHIAIGAGLLALGFVLGRLTYVECNAQLPIASPELVVAPAAPAPAPAPPLIAAEPVHLRLPAVEPSAQPPITDAPAPPTHDIDVNEAMAILAKAMRDHPTVNGDDQLFADKHRDMSLDQIQAAHITLDHQFNEETKRIVAERLKQGLYEEAVRGDGKTLSLTTSKGSYIAMGGFTQDAEGVSRMTSIPPNEYPAFDDLHREWMWLENKLHGSAFTHRMTGSH